MRLLLLFLLLLAFTVGKTQLLEVEGIGYPLPGEPVQMQWDGLHQSVLISVHSDSGNVHFRIKPADAVIEPLCFTDMPLYVAAHPVAEVYAGASSDGRPWRSGNYKFLSRFGSRNITLRQPAFNPAGNLLAFSAQVSYRKAWQLMTFDLKYDNLNTFPTLPEEVLYPVWSPKGSYLAFVLPSEHPLRQKAAVIRWDGTGLKYLESDTLSILHLAWTDTESSMLMSVKTPSGWAIIKQRISEEHVQVLYHSRVPIGFLLWIPPRKQVAFLTKNAGLWELRMLETAF